METLDTTRYYRLDNRRITYAEYLRIVRSWKVIILWVAKLLNIQLRARLGWPYFESVRDMEVQEADFPARAREQLQPLLDQWMKLGFHSPRFFTFESICGETQASFISMFHNSGTALRLLHRVNANVTPPKEKLQAVLLNELRDGTFFLASDRRPESISVPGTVGNHLLKATPEQLLAFHRQKLAELPIGNPAQPAATPDLQDDLWDRLEKRLRDYSFQRGIFVWMTPEEVAEEQGRLAAVKALPESVNPENTGVLLELHRIQNQKARGGRVLLLSLASLALFIAIGAQHWAWDYLLILMGVLLVHETGHYVAMRAFHYQNVRMFFIPMFGAAVSGGHYNVPGWKKVIVTLMGPLPGIVLGVIAGLAGMIMHQPLLLKVALISLIINGLNLLPMLPFDGGWIFQTLLFSRNCVLDTIVRAITAVAMLALGVLAQSKIFDFLGVLMLFTLPAANLTARIARDVKKMGLPPAAENTQDIPPGTAEAIIAEVKRRGPKLRSTATIARQTLQIFETINARPPGWVATIGFLFIQAAAIALAVVSAGVFTIEQHGGFLHMLADLNPAHMHQLSKGSVACRRGKMAAVGPTSEITIIGEFPTHRRASKIYGNITPLPPASSLRIFGEALLFSVPADQDNVRKKWLAYFHHHAKPVFVDSDADPAIFSLTAVAPNLQSAKAIAGELKAYLNTLPGQPLIPPWQPRDKRSAELQAKNELARQTYLEAEKAQIQVYRHKSVIALDKQIAKAERDGAQTRTRRLKKRIAALAAKYNQKAMADLRNGADGAVDPKVVDLYAAWMADMKSAHRKSGKGVRHQLAQRMGVFPLVNGKPQPDDLRFAAHYGTVTRKDRTIRLMYISFYHIDAGAPALTKWLWHKRCAKLTYSFQPGAVFADQ